MDRLEKIAQLQKDLADLRETQEIVELMKQDYPEILSFKQPQNDEFRALVGKGYRAWANAQAIERQLRRLQPKPKTNPTFKRYNPRQYYK